MKLHKYISVLCVAALSLWISSCDSFLEENPLDEKSAGQFWKTRADAQTGVNALYFGGVPYLHNIEISGGWTPKATMWGGIMSGLFVDQEKNGSFTNYSEAATFTIEVFTSTAQSLWSEFYIGVSRANFVIANIPTMTGVLSEKEIAYYVAQGKFFRAYSYFYLVKEFGDVPYIDRPYTSLEGIFQARTPAEEVYKHIEDDLLSIINGGALPNKTFYDNGGYVTLAMAQTLLAQVYLQRAGAPLNGGREYYAKAAAMAQQVINSNTHALIDPDGTTDDLTSAFNIIKTSKKTNVASKIEIIYAKEYNQSGLGVGNSYAARSIEKAAFQGWKLLHPAGDVLYTAYRPCNMLIESYHPGDIRGHNQQFFFKEYISPHDGNKYTLNAQGNWAWYDEAALIGGRNGDYNMPMFRYAEVLLIAAEGYAQTGENTKARDYLNQVRKRAGLEDETAAAGEALVKIILTERFHEFPLEFKIWDDIRRTRLYPEADGVESGNLKWTSLESATIQNKPKQNETTVGAIKPYVLLWPIPLREMQANPALAGHQNPGWE